VEDIFGNLPVEGGKGIFEEVDEEYATTKSNSGSGSASEAGKMEITNKEACIIFILLISFTNYKSLQLAYSLPRKFIAENTCNKKLRSKKWMAQSDSLAAAHSSKKAHVVDVDDEGEPSPTAQLSKVCYIH